MRVQAPIVVANLLAATNGEPPPKAYDGYGSCPLTVAYGKIVLAEFADRGKVTASFPLDPRVPRRSMWLLKTKLLHWLYRSHMFKGGEFDIPTAREAGDMLGERRLFGCVECMKKPKVPRIDARLNQRQQFWSSHVRYTD